MFYFQHGLEDGGCLVHIASFNLLRVPSAGKSSRPRVKVLAGPSGSSAQHIPCPCLRSGSFCTEGHGPLPDGYGNRSL